MKIERKRMHSKVPNPYTQMQPYQYPYRLTQIENSSLTERDINSNILHATERTGA